jgi:putative restriction endonuclease
MADHSIHWHLNKEQRMNPRNGLCLSSIHDLAFEKGFLKVTTDYKIKISNVIFEYKENESISDFFLKYNTQKSSLTDKFFPSQELLEYHHDHVFHK